MKHYFHAYSVQDLHVALPVAIDGFQQVVLHLADDQFTALSHEVTAMLCKEYRLIKTMLNTGGEAVSATAADPLMSGIRDSTGYFLSQTQDPAVWKATLVAGCMVYLEYLIHANRFLANQAERSADYGRSAWFRSTFIKLHGFHQTYAKLVRLHSGRGTSRIAC